MSRLLAGVACAGAGLATGWLVHAHPEALRVPAWVAYVACAAFVVAGLLVAAGEGRAMRPLRDWLAVLLLVALFVPGAWVAFGPGPRACRVSLPLMASAAGEVLCRGAFGLGAILMGVMVAWALRLALRPRPASLPTR